MSKKNLSVVAAAAAALAVTEQDATVAEPKRPPVAEPATGGSFIRYPDGSLERDPEQPAQEAPKPRDARMAPAPKDAQATTDDTGADAGAASAGGTADQAPGGDAPLDRA